ncbi:MAG TPA: precorrin-3B C(17)-methyltransferase [Conexibacter sp.]|jgi:precorrin-2 C20-methyltransferase/precorrin-3B C17-methyltransferase|nr:precorrin-3B C(17)-methyltransferase [Conexibacter sp.]
MSAGRLYGVGVGPGDPELLTHKAARAIADADVIAYPSARHGKSVARRIAAPYLREDHVEVLLRFPVTTELTTHPGGYDAALHEFYDEASAELAEHLDAGRDVAILCEGDPLFYGSYMYFHERLAPRYATTVIPGVTAFSAAAAAAGTPLVKREDVFVAVPGTLPADVLAERLRGADAAVVMKLGRTFPKVREAAERAGVGERAIYVERASSDAERIAPLAEAGDQVPYMSLVLVPTAARPEQWATADAARTVANGGASRGSLAVVGLGPAGPEWLTPEAREALAAADDIVGYAPYVARVPERAGQRRHASDNRVELERARHALELAAGGARVAVVSSGDPGIFAMASAVMEALDEDADPAYAHVDVRIVPGLSAMQAAAARVGAPLGHDFCVISLSDQLKPWEAIERRLDAAGAGDFALALYNPASRTRREQLTRAREVLLRHRTAETPVVVARAVGAPEEAIDVTTLGGLDLELVDMRTLLIVGSSTTRVLASGNGGPPRVYTPRRYPA